MIGLPSIDNSWRKYYTEFRRKERHDETTPFYPGVNPARPIVGGYVQFNEEEKP